MEQDQLPQTTSPDHHTRNLRKNTMKKVAFGGFRMQNFSKAPSSSSTTTTTTQRQQHNSPRDHHYPITIPPPVDPKTLKQDATNSSGTRGSDRISGSSDSFSYTDRESDSYHRSYRNYSIANSQFKADEVDQNIENIKVSEDEAPERAITLFAFRLAILEKTASGIGAVAFIWATVVLLGGFSVYVSVVEFWVVSALLVTEGTRIFFRSHELECQQLGYRSNFSIVVAGINIAHAGSSLAHRSERAVRGALGFAGSSGDEKCHRDSLPQGQVVDDSPRGYESRTPTTPASRKSLPPSPNSSTIDQPAKSAQRIAAGLSSTTIPRTWSTSMLPLFPYTQILTAKGMAQFLYVCQFLSATVCLGMSLWRLVNHNFTILSTPSNEVPHNVAYSVYIFYVLSFLEAFIFLIERTYWEFKINHVKLLLKVSEKLVKAAKDTELVASDFHEMTQSFFYEVYSKCLTVSVFDGLEMDLVSYSMKLLQDNDASRVLGGSKILRAFVEQDQFRGDVLRRIGVAPGVIERLVEMLAWHHKDELQIRLNSAAIVKGLVYHTRNNSRVVAVAGALENIMSLFQWEVIEELVHGAPACKLTPKEAIELRTYGLGILKCLASDHTYSRRIGEVRGLLPVLVGFLDIRRYLKEDSKSIRQSLEVLSILASTTGGSGTILRPAITSVVSAIPRLRDILHHHEGDVKERQKLQSIAVDVLNNLALDTDSRKVIGCTGGVIANLLLLFTYSYRSVPPAPRDQATSTAIDDEQVKKEWQDEKCVAMKAGEALNRLALRDKTNCHRILRTQFPDRKQKAATVVIEILKDEQDEYMATRAAWILRGLFQFSSHSTQAEVAETTEFLLHRVMLSTDRGTREAALGLAAKTLPTVNEGTFAEIFSESGRLDRHAVIKQLMQFLDHVPSTTKQPRLRRYAVELICVLLERNEEIKSCFLNEGLTQKLHRVLDNVSDVENYLLFSGGMGLIRHTQEMEWLVEKALYLCGELNYDDQYQSASNQPAVTLRLNGNFTGQSQKI